MTNQTTRTSNDLPDAGRRTLLIMTGATVAAAGLFSVGAAPARAQASADWDKTFPRSENVSHTKVTFPNRYGITLSGDLYVPADRGDARLPALALSGPFGAVKEQSSGLYAQTMAERGFVALAFDPSFVGESGGGTHAVASPDINTEDFMAAVDYLGLHPSVDRERIGLLAVCGLSGMALNAATVDKRVKAVAVASMYDMSRVMARGYYDALTPEGRAEMLEQISRQRWADAEETTPALAGGLPDTLDGIDDPVITMYWNYYKTDRGFHPRSLNSTTGWTVTNPLSFMNMPMMTYVEEISPRPVLLIAGSEAHSRYFSEDVYAAAAEPKELMIIEGADHVDLYDQREVIPFDRLAAFFGEHLAA
jgi:fermentation-respiration switch protein FrsA (DUF1100 family)